MTRRVTPWLFASFSLGCAVATAIPSQVVPEAHASNVPRWEYVCHRLDRGEYVARATDGQVVEISKEALDSYGREGWELTELVGGVHPCFKRPLSQ
jgi:hypothetical protein